MFILRDPPDQMDRRIDVQTTRFADELSMETRSNRDFRRSFVLP